MWVQSHPLRVRGLKSGVGGMGFNIGLSHPLRVRGLKFHNAVFARFNQPSHPFVGAWIKFVEASRILHKYVN